MNNYEQQKNNKNNFSICFHCKQRCLYCCIIVLFVLTIAF